MTALEEKEPEMTAECLIEGTYSNAGDVDDKGLRIEDIEEAAKMLDDLQPMIVIHFSHFVDSICHGPIVDKLMAPHISSRRFKGFIVPINCRDTMYREAKGLFHEIP